MLPHNPTPLALSVFEGEFCPEIQLHNIPQFCRAQLVGTTQQIGQFFQSLSWWTTELSVRFGLKNVKKALPSQTSGILATGHLCTPLEVTIKCQHLVGVG